MHAGHIEETFAPNEISLSPNNDLFAELFKNLRKKLVGKQACLSGAGLWCTDAAISHWERGYRLPRPKMMRNAVRVLADLGATAGDLEQLMLAWTAAYLGKRPQRDRTAAQNFRSLMKT